MIFGAVGDYLLQILNQNNYLCVVMREFSERVARRILKIPMAVVVLPFATGIFFAEAVALPMWLSLLFCVTSLVGAIALSKWWQNCAVLMMIFAIGSLLHGLSYRGDIPYNKPLSLILKIETSSAYRKGYTSAEARVEACEDNSVTGHRVILWGDSLTRFSAGDQLRLTATLRPFKSKYESYARLLHHRRFVGSVAVGSRSNYDYIPTERESLHDWAVGRLRSVIAQSEARATLLAMTTGEKSELSGELRQGYSASGASHLLAVSGLHIGIVFMLVNLLLLPLVLLRYGNILRSVLAIVLVWLYVWLCGFSPSAVRAAMMFSMLQFSLSSLREYASVNILAGTAFVMLAFDTHLLFDISFQLSFIAVAGIVLWGVPLCRLCHTRFAILNLLIDSLVISVVSTLATMPLVANAFAIISPIGMVIAPVVITIAYMVVVLGVMTIAIPPLAPVAELAAQLQNRVVEWAAAIPSAHFDVALSDGKMWCVYGVFVVATIPVWLFLVKGDEVGDKKKAKLSED